MLPNQNKFIGAGTAHYLSSAIMLIASLSADNALTLLAPGFSGSNKLIISEIPFSEILIAIS